MRLRRRAGVALSIMLMVAGCAAAPSGSGGGKTDTGRWHREPIPANGDLTSVSAGGHSAWAFAHIFLGGRNGWRADAFQRADNGAWHQVEMPYADQVLDSVTRSPTDAFAATTNGLFHWNGSSWQPVNDRNATALATVGDGVWAVDGATVSRWDGTTWTDIPPPPRFSQLTAITGIGPDDVWVAGIAGPDKPPPPPELGTAAHWDGQRWTDIVLPSPFDYDALRVDDLEAVAPNDVWAVGGRYIYDAATRMPQWRPAALHWDGAAWRDVAVPPGPERVTSLAKTGGEVWAVAPAPSPQVSIPGPHMYVQHVTTDGLVPVADAPEGVAGAATDLDGTLLVVGNAQQQETFAAMQR